MYYRKLIARQLTVAAVSIAYLELGAPGRDRVVITACKRALDLQEEETLRPGMRRRQQGILAGSDEGVE